MFDLLSELNWLAVIVAAVAWFVFSGIWYAQAVLGRSWQQAVNVTLPEGYRPPPSTFVITLFAYLLTAIAIGLLVAALGITQVGDAIELGVVLGIGFTVAELLLRVTYERRSWSLVWITGLNALIAFSGMAIILAVWEK
jgi:hypothetical protein